MQYLRVKNFDKYQHYKDRNPPWVKLYRCILNDYEFCQLPIPSRLVYVFCIILASESDNRIPHDYRFLSGRCAMEVNEVVLTPLIQSGFLLACGARRLLASCKRFATSSSLLSSSEEPLNPDLKTLHSPDLNPKSLKTPDLKIKSKDRSPKSAATWSAYCAAFLSRYGTEPVRNAKTNSCLSRLVDRLGTEAPGVAAFYCTHDGLLYVRSKHCVDLLLRDAEGLRMEWVTGRQVTNGQAVMTDRTSTTGAIVKKLIAEEEAKHVDRLT